MPNDTVTSDLKLLEFQRARGLLLTGGALLDWQTMHVPLLPYLCLIAKCPYCCTYGELGRCTGCGAPNEPARL